MLFRKAILMIHGFAGGIYDFEELLNYLQLDKHFDVFTFTLPGHNKNLSKSKYQDWIKKSEEEIEWLIAQGYKNIYVIGHSMGCVITCYLATKYKEIKKIVLGAPAFQYLNVKNEDLNVKESLMVTPKIINEYGSDEVVSRFLKLNISTLKEFMTLVKKYYDVPKDVMCPVLILHGDSDHLIPISSSEYVYDKLNKNVKKLIYVKGATHDIFKGEKQEQIFEEIKEFLKHKTEGGKHNI